MQGPPVKLGFLARPWRWYVCVIIACIAAFNTADNFTTAGDWMNGAQPAPTPLLSDSIIIAPFLLIAALPTIVLYRLAIFGGERLGRRCPALGAVLSVSMAAVLPPAIYNACVDWSLREPRLFGPKIEVHRTIALLDSHAAGMRGSGRVACSADCQRLLFTDRVSKVLVGPEPKYRELINGSTPVTAIWIEDRENCPPAAIRLLSARGSDIDERSLKWVAAGRCLRSAPAHLNEADLVLRRESRDSFEQARNPLTGILRVESYVADIRAGNAFHTASRQIQYSNFKKLTYPFSIWWPQWHWLGMKLEERYSPFQSNNLLDHWPGIAPDLPDDLSDRNVVAMLQAALATPKSTPPDARFQLVELYLKSLVPGHLVEGDRELVRDIASDPRIRIEQLGGLHRIGAAAADPELDKILSAKLNAASHDSDASRRLVAMGGPRTGEFLMDQLESIPTEDTLELRHKASQILDLPDATLRLMMPRIRELLEDKERRGAAKELFHLFRYGNDEDAKAILRLFRESWRMVPPVPNEQRTAASDAEWDRLTEDRDLSAIAVCVLPGRHPELDAALAEAVRVHANDEDVSLWQIRSAMIVRGLRIPASLTVSPPDSVGYLPHGIVLDEFRKSGRCP